jgi:hypothetical protein
MKRQIARPLAEYLTFLASQPETRLNNSLIDCCIYLLQEKPDTEESLNATRNQD